jgi:uncharacterized HAD superfamily protein
MNTDILQDDDEDGESPNAKAKKHDEFLLAEYSSIAQAYFNTTTTISTFFKNYLVIVGLPIPVFVFLLTQLSKGGVIPSIPNELSPLVPGTGGLIWLLGLCVMLYVVNLRLDALLYARTINGIRRHFYDRSGIHYPEELKTRVLPRSTFQPRYFEWHYFLSVIAVFALLNTLYLILAFAWYLHHVSCDGAAIVWASLATCVVSLFLHYLAYWGLTRFRETRYLRKFIIGLDIDGVLNKHREHFCDMLRQLCDKQVDPAQITWIPVHECKGLGVGEAEADAVFNHPGYWRDLPPMEGAAQVLSKLKNVLGYKLFVFTHRPWPEPKKFPADPEKASHYRYLWAQQSFRNPFGHRGILKLTRAWLKKHGIPYNGLLIEKGNVHTTDRRIRVRNRFTVSERKEIRIFIEDDLFKARKLATICEIVFLLDHPYNQADDLPKNMIRVKTWKDIYEYIRQEL